MTMHPQDREPNYQTTINTTTALARPEDRMRAMAVPTSLDHMYNIAERMKAANLVPTSIGTIEGAFLAMCKGAEFGLLPQQSLAGFYVIGNIAHPYGTCLRGIVRASPGFEDEIEGCVEGVAEMRHMASEQNPYEPGSARQLLFAELQRSLTRRLKRVEERAGNKSIPAYFCGYSVLKRQGADPVCVLFDSFDSERTQLSARSDVWKKYPQRMHMHRAGAYNRREVFSSALMGLEMTAEEAMDLTPAERSNAIDAHATEVRAANPGQNLDKLAGAVRVVQTKAEEITQSYARPTPTPPAPPREDAPPPATGADRAAIYAGQGNPPPTSDMPHESDVPGAKSEPIGTEVKPPTKQKSAGNMALRNAHDQCQAAGLDGVEVGKQVMVRMFGEGVKTSEISDDERISVANAMMAAAKQSGAPETDDPLEDESAF